MRISSKEAFTLVELSIVLIIIGLLVGAILAGQELVEQAKINKTITEFRKLHAAMNSFKSKYNGIPGDFSKALNFFSACGTGGAVSCNGDGDEKIFDVGGQVTGVGAGEDYKVFLHLKLASIYENGFDNTEYISQLNPESAECSRKIYSPIALNEPNCISLRSDITIYNKSYRYYIRTTNDAHKQAAASLTPKQSFQIDSKIDDGNPFTGYIQAGKGYNNPSTCTNASSPYTWTQAIPANPAYLITNSSVECILFYMIQ